MSNNKSNLHSFVPIRIPNRKQKQRSLCSMFCRIVFIRNHFNRNKHRLVPVTFESVTFVTKIWTNLFGLKNLENSERVTEVTSSKLWLFWYSRRVCTNLVKVIRFSNQHFRRSFGSRRFVRISKSFANSPSKFQGSSFCRLDSSRYQHRTGVYQETSTISIRFLFFFLLMVLNTFQTSLD